MEAICAYETEEEHRAHPEAKTESEFFSPSIPIKSSAGLKVDSIDESESTEFRVSQSCAPADSNDTFSELGDPPVPTDKAPEVPPPPIPDDIQPLNKRSDQKKMTSLTGGRPRAGSMDTKLDDKLRVGSISLSQEVSASAPVCVVEPPTDNA